MLHSCKKGIKQNGSISPWQQAHLAVVLLCAKLFDTEE